MLTARAWWTIVVGVGMFAFGVLAEHALLGMLGLVFLGWIVVEGSLFHYRARTLTRGLSLRRQVRDDRGPVGSLWAGRTYEVRTQIRLDRGWLPYLMFDDLVPFAAELVDGSSSVEGAIASGKPVFLAYRLKAAHPGAVRFEGVRYRLTDLGGFFYKFGFVRLEAVFRVLPALVDAEGKTATSKRSNLLPPPGIHRLPRPGSGSELLDLRDYMPGDPPKTIAWKVSARRDKLITREYESEVPVRCTLFVDTSQSVRLGPPGRNALTRLVEIAAGLGQANLASRDLSGLCLFDENGTTIMKPARTKRHLVQLFSVLADAVAKPAVGDVLPIEPYLPLAYAFAREVHPDLLDDDVNRMPSWVPILYRISSHWIEPAEHRSRAYRAIVYTLMGAIYILTATVLEGELHEFYDELPEGVQEELLPTYDRFFYAFLVVACLGFPLWMAFWRDVLPNVFHARRRRVAQMRKKLAALFARRYDLGPGGLELLLEDDRRMGEFVERYLQDHHVQHVPRLFDDRGRYMFRSVEKVSRAAAALLRAVGRGRDNELFVLMIDLVGLDDDMEPLVRAVKVALSRHHQVMLVIPWPPDIELPRRDAAREQPKPMPAAKKSRKPTPRMTLDEMHERVEKLNVRRHQRSFEHVRRAFARMQVPVLCAAEGDPIRLVLDRIDRLRGQKRRRR